MQLHFSLIFILIFKAATSRVAAAEDTNVVAVDSTVERIFGSTYDLTANGRKKLLAQPGGAEVVAKIYSAASIKTNVAANDHRSLATQITDNKCSSCRDYSYQHTTCSSNCKRCGYSNDPAAVGDYYNCISCEDGYTLDVYFADCTGACVLDTVVNDPVSSSDCELPCAQCGFPYHSWAASSSCDNGSDTSLVTGSAYTGDDFCYDGSESDDDVTGACRYCGYDTNSANAGGADKCISCGEDHEIDVIYSDCTGYCVPVGEAVNPISESDCKMPAAACGGEFDGFVTPRSGAAVTVARRSTTTAGLATVAAAAACWIL